ncbi:hypothetical protein HDV01_000949 [Terramyces sp. JEL0728]|nr:hypothetical protein HDV01_000949 [Terramyces sp. JEL0728]
MLLSSWPPKPKFNYDSIFNPYVQAAAYASANLATCSPSTDNVYNINRINSFRKGMERILETVDIATIDSALRKNTHSMDDAHLMGLLACLDFLRHAYRWGTTPIVRIAQLETIVFPIQLELPAILLHEHFGISPPSGTLFSMTYCNVMERADGGLDIVYSSTGGMNEDVRTTERNNALVFYRMEEKAVLLYQCIFLANDLYESGLHSESLLCLKAVKGILKAVFSLFYEHLAEPNIKKEYWLPYAQGFHGWAIGGVDGVSGNQAVVIRVLDLFLELKHQTAIGKEQKSSKHHPKRILDFLEKVSQIKLRSKTLHLPEFADQFKTLSSAVKIWRMSHSKKAIHYESVELKERLPMTGDFY